MVKTGGDGDAILDAIFEEMNSAYQSASASGLKLIQKDFDSYDAIQDYVKKIDYVHHPICFSIGWDVFKPETNEF